MRAVSVLALLTLACASAGCDDTRELIDSGAPRPDGSVARPDGGPRPDGSSPSDGGSSPDGGSVPGIAVCQPGCTVLDDCVTGSPAFDADNYSCETGLCRYTGCVSDDECRGVFGSSYACRDAGSGIPTCLQACAAVADCGAGSPAFDMDNYRCESTVCVYEGCRDDAECEGTYGTAYGCFDVRPPDVGLPIPTAARNCVKRCAGPADCAIDSGAFDASSWECVGGGCRYLGCGDDAQCRTTFGDTYVCR